ncbi:MAG: potassium transporter [Gammaproteobacteria bacterium]|nr:potassium transporter [Gammaproteobacteria bacterium]MCP5200820.1 potassium transporter [Gammaproteobacteria bacterium]
MNALEVASQYLPRGARVMLVERRARSGGMWCDTYDYVHLHQPHPMFTAGDVEWTLGAPPQHLASKPEILDHFQRCHARVREHFTLDERFGWAYVAHEEVAVGDGWQVEVQVRPLGGDGGATTVRARHCIRAFGFEAPRNPPLELSSTAVASLSPDGGGLLGPAAVNPDKPVWVVGGGKTGMDTAHAVLSAWPGREVNLLVGRGTAFMSRDRSFPTGLRRWWGGKLTLRTFTDLARRFDGDNEQEVFAHFMRRYAVTLDPGFGQYLLGLMSEAENAFIRAGIREYVKDYLVDVVDADGVPMMVLRSGARRPVVPGTVFVNCTGYVLRGPTHYEPYVSPHGTVVTVSPNAGIHILTTFASYFLTHLLYLGKLQAVPLYEVDHHALLAANRTAMPFVCMAQILYNLLLILDAVPMSVMRGCGLDFDRWFPLPRRIAAGLHLDRNKADYRAHCRRTLDRVRARFGIRCGVLEGRREAA